jgi:hypothetical protein
MRKTVLVVLFVVGVSRFDVANATDECGPGCHPTSQGACIVDGWGSGAPIWNECPAGARPRPPCGTGYVWRPRLRACFQR